MAKKASAPAKKGFLGRLADKLDPLKPAQKAGKSATQRANQKVGGGARKRHLDQILKDAGASRKSSNSKSRRTA